MWVEGQNGTGGSGDPLTPSNSTPQAIAQSHVYEAQGNGYAIESYRSVTPSSLPNSLTGGEIVKINQNGYVVESFISLNPTTPERPDEIPVYAVAQNIRQTKLYAYPAKMPYVQIAQIYHDTVRNGTKTFKLANNARDYWLMTATFRNNYTSAAGDTYGGTWVVRGTYDGGQPTLTSSVDSAVTNLTVSLTQTGSDWYISVKSTASSYYYDVRISRITQNRYD